MGTGNGQGITRLWVPKAPKHSWSMAEPATVTSLSLRQTSLLGTMVGTHAWWLTPPPVTRALPGGRGTDLAVVSRATQQWGCGRMA